MDQTAPRRRGGPLDLTHQPTGRGRGGPGQPKTTADVNGRAEDLAELLDQGYSLLHAAERLRISYRTVFRYRTRLQAQQGAA